MAGKSKAGLVNATIEVDGKQYAPGMSLPLPKKDVDALIQRFGAYEGEPVDGEPKALARPQTRARKATSSSDAPQVVLSPEALHAHLEAAAEAGALRAFEIIAADGEIASDDDETPDDGDGSQPSEPAEPVTPEPVA